MHSNSTAVCQDLDDLLLQYMVLVDEHLAACTRISGRFQEGRELISQAKYIMGPKNVSADCYDHRMKALRGINVKGATEIEISDLLAKRQRQAKEAQEQELEQEQETELTISGENPADGSLGQDRSGLRRRGGGGGIDSGSTLGLTFENMDDHQDKKEKAGMMAVAGASSGSPGSAASTSAVTGVTKKKKERNPDPLLWFGLQDVVDIAMIRQRLYQLETRIQELQEDKTGKPLQQQIPDVGALTLETSQ
ncbi:hypothetical protein BGZ70_006378 [Mortierella alpina]|uniref:Vacuolar ATPase assembly protein VMA22 n=1 Tax=Mortierella alpina TaxID=64518 RepID=A0A9P6J7S0_MORAP|nr:hypothetical protein BGZ70_006378 [Mortierella alpina]